MLGGGGGDGGRRGRGRVVVGGEGGVAEAGWLLERGGRGRPKIQCAFCSGFWCILGIRRFS